MRALRSAGAPTLGVVPEPEHESNEPLRHEAERIRRSGDYRWVGIYEVGDDEIRALAWTGDAPTYASFPRDRGLCGAAVADGMTVISHDVRLDSRYLTTFGSTLSEIVVPIRREGRVVGLVDVESDRVAAFGTPDRERIERHAAELAATWQ